MTTQLADALTLRIERVIRAPRERVFDAWTQFSEMRKWIEPSPHTAPEGSADLRVGGKFTITMVRADGTQHVAQGEYREIARPSRIVYTHSWVRDGGRSNEHTPETLVTVEFHEEHHDTRVVLTQTGFTDTTNRDNHIGGWSAALNNLGKLLEREQ